MERTVTYTEEVEREESLVVCDECQREVDENGMEYHPPNYATQGGPTLHFCSECLDDMTNGKFVPEHVQRAEKWMDTDLGGYTIRDNLVLARRASAVLCLFAVFAAALINVGVLGGATFALLAITIGLLVVYWLFTEVELTNSPYY